MKTDMNYSIFYHPIINSSCGLVSLYNGELISRIEINMSNTNWSNRDDAVVPWISLKKKNDCTKYVSSSDNYSRGNLTGRCKILSLLAQRERSGSSNYISNELVKSGAW